VHAEAKIREIWDIKRLRVRVVNDPQNVFEMYRKNIRILVPLGHLKTTL